ncbi:hypothetical protein MMC22_000619 [Lobaria immixta]|nr:hypothetical protein [Lobaria immixta]
MAPNTRSTSAIAEPDMAATATDAGPSSAETDSSTVDPESTTATAAANMLTTGPTTSSAPGPAPTAFSIEAKDPNLISTMAGPAASITPLSNSANPILSSKATTLMQDESHMEQPSWSASQATTYHNLVAQAQHIETHERGYKSNNRQDNQRDNQQDNQQNGQTSQNKGNDSRDRSSNARSDYYRGNNQRPRQGNNYRDNRQDCRNQQSRPPPNKPNSLSEEEKKRRKDNNLCFVCGKPGHRANICPDKAKN